MTNLELCTKALKTMKTEFSSNRFSKKLKSLGVDPYFISSKGMHEFLEENCDRGISKRMWIKRSNLEISIIGNNTLFTNNDDVIIHAINLLKNTGKYRIMQRTEEWTEL
jgi:hypothetical protein